MSPRAFGLATLGMLLLFVSGPAMADEATPSTTPAPALVGRAPAPAPAFPVAPATGGTFQLAIYFVLLVSLLGGGVYVMRNGLGFLQPKPKGPRKLDITETRMLGNRQFLIVAEFEQRKMLIGVCPGRIDYLCTLSGAEPEFPRLPSEEES
ncbi:MAG: flagellar biosynthetic protein FliO [Chthoniobacteraceae bacterium]